MEKTFYIVEDMQDQAHLLKIIMKKQFPQFKLVGESDRAETALEEIPKVLPDIIFSDFSLPGMNGIEMVAKLKEKNLKCMCILIVTSHEIEIYRCKAIEAGANEIIPKGDHQALVDAIKRHC